MIVCEPAEDAGRGEMARVGLKWTYIAKLSNKSELSSFALAVSDQLKLFNVLSTQPNLKPLVEPVYG